MAEIVLQGVTKSFGKTEVIHKTDVTINDGEFVVMVGPSGCGKSTLLRMIAGLETTTEGEIRIAGKRVTKDGVLVIRADEHRMQEQNRAAAAGGSDGASAG